MLTLAACVQTGGAHFKADLKEAARINTQLGMIYLQQGKLELAQSKLQKALEQDDDQAKAHWGLALVHARFKENAKAERYFQQAHKLEPKNPNILASHGQFQCQQGEVEAAQASFDKALSMTRYLAPEVALTNAGVCYLQHGQHTPAEQKLRRALDYNPRYHRALMQLANLSYEKSDYQRCQAFLQRMGAQSSNNPDVLLLGLRTEYALDNKKAARSYSDALRRAMPDIANRIDLKTGKAW